MNKPAALLILAGGALILYSQQSQASTDAAPPDTSPPPDGGSWVDSILGVFNVPSTAPTMNANRAALLATIRKSETGTTGQGAYSMLVGGGTFTSFADHPGVYVARFNSTAAGAYQINKPTWAEIQNALHLPDFSPASQDTAALWLLNKSGALAAIDSGDFATAISLAAPRWASLPGAGYGQHENSLASLVGVYQGSGGIVV